jgi:hypothetical protein
MKKEFLVGNNETTVRVEADYILSWPERTILVDADGEGPGGNHVAVITPSAFVVKIPTPAS